MTTVEPLTVAEVDPHAVYPLKVAAKLLGVSVVTFLRHSNPDGIIRPTPTSWKRIKGSEILRQFGQREIDRGNRTPAQGETERERVRRAQEAMQRLNNTKQRGK